MDIADNLYSVNSTHRHFHIAIVKNERSIVEGNSEDLLTMVCFEMRLNNIPIKNPLAVLVLQPGVLTDSGGGQLLQAQLVLAYSNPQNLFLQ